MRTDSKRSWEGTVLAASVWALALVLIYLGAMRWLPPLASLHGAGIDRMLDYLLITTGALVLAGHVVLGSFILRAVRAAEPSPGAPSARAERIGSVAPAILMTLVAEGGVLVIGLPVWAQLYGSAPPEDAVLVEITAEQFTWHVRYPGEDGALGRTQPSLISAENPIGLDPSDAASGDDRLDLGVIYLPVNRAARIRLRSKDVLHSFYLPNFRVKQDAVPGMAIDLWFVPTREGEFELACAELCGFGHYQMRGTVYVVTEAEWEERLREMRRE